jgi:deazaflavin-dependent oxidoreductase (nitroreductase family)
MTATDPSTPHPNRHRSDASPGYRTLLSIGGCRFTAFERRFNALFLRVAGSRYLRLYGVVLHRGRQSGRAYATPVVVQPTADGFVLPLLAGEGADWFQNLRAAGRGVVRWNGREYPVADPVVIDWAAARPWFGRLARVYVTLLGFQLFLRVSNAAARTEDPTAVAQRSK